MAFTLKPEPRRPMTPPVPNPTPVGPREEKVNPAVVREERERRAVMAREEADVKRTDGTPLTIIKPTLSADERARDVQAARVPNKSKLTDDEAATLTNLRLQGTVNQEQALEYHRLLTLVGE